MNAYHESASAARIPRISGRIVTGGIGGITDPAPSPALPVPAVPAAVALAVIQGQSDSPLSAA
jgi:hypothetical protein